jgi:hypothetical protein
VNWRKFIQEPVIVLQGTSAVMSIFLVTSLLLAYCFPINVVIDKIAKTITYQYVILFPNNIERSQSNDRWFFIQLRKVMPIEKLQKIADTTDTPGVIRSGRTGSTLAKYQFVLDKDENVDIYAGPFTLFTHKYACRKIAQYLHLPYEEKIYLENPLSFQTLAAAKKSLLVKVLMTILVGLILFLVMFVGIIFLIAFLRHGM